MVRGCKRGSKRSTLRYSTSLQLFTILCDALTQGAYWASIVSILAGRKNSREKPRMSKKWRLTDRTRTLLTLELAIVLPAAALMGFSVWNLKHLQRSEAVEAAIQRDFSHVLKIAEKKSWQKANDLLAPVRKQFP